MRLRNPDNGREFEIADEERAAYLQNVRKFTIVKAKSEAPKKAAPKKARKKAG